MFTELRAKTNLSFLEGASDTREYIRRAKHLGMSSIGISDTNGVYGLPRALEAIRDDCPEVKLICGADITLLGHPRTSLHAKSNAGWKLLCQILTALHHGKEKGEGFLTIEQLADLVNHSQASSELICISDFHKNNHIGSLKEIFKDHTYISLCRYLDARDRTRTQNTLKASAYFGLPIVATNDVRYHESHRKPLLDCFTSVKHGQSLDQKDYRWFQNRERYLKDDLQMKALFSDLPEAIYNSKIIADECKFTISDIKHCYPLKFIPEGFTSAEYLKKLVFEGAIKRYGRNLSEKVSLQINQELKIIIQQKREGFFLNNYDICQFAKSANIYYNARGSAVNSITCYCLFISSIDPVRNNLNFSRFLSIARNEPPDIDIDFEHNRREEVIQWIYARYGRKSAAMVAAFQTYKPDGATLDFSKALGAEVGTITAGALRKKLNQAFGEKAFRIPMLDTLMGEAMDSPRNISTHPGGFLLCEDLSEIVPVEPARMDQRTIIQWDKNDIETLGLMKEDILSIGALTSMRITCDLVGIHHEDIPWDCPKTFEMIRRGHTYGVFQLESRAQINTLPHTQPKSQYDLVMQVSIIRPLASEGGMVKSFLIGKRRRLYGEQILSGNTIVDEILDRTNGVPLFPEQMMAIARRVGNFDEFETEKLRKSLGKHRSAEAVNDIAVRLYKKLIESSVTKEFADSFFRHVQGYSSYGFPESHAASYAAMAYKTAYLKCHHPAEFLVGLLEAQPMGFYPKDCLIYDAQRNGNVKIKPIHPNISVWDAILEAPQTVRMGYRDIRGFREEAFKALITARKEREFSSLEDFITRTQLSADVLENMALANIFECWGLDRKHTFWQTLEFHRLIKRNSGSIQFSLFDERAANTPVTNLFSTMSLVAEQFLDYYILGYSPLGNPMSGLRQKLPHLPKMTSADFNKMRDGTFIKYAAMNTTLQRPPPAKGTAFMTLEDELGVVNAVFSKKVFDKYRAEISKSRFLIVSGKVKVIKIQTENGIIEQRKFIANSCEAFGEVADSKPVRPQQHPKALGKISSEYAFEF